ncbi:hypothetical protein GO491_11830 [Flavobacteriaceae bacterium Ap0902]|nr:hypothetical protein [Flavobacteriaceae bacterium Ap0902]
MYAIIYEPNRKLAMNGQFFYKVKALYEGDAYPVNGIVIDEDAYNAWKENISYFHYVNENARTINTAVKHQVGISDYNKLLKTKNIKEQMREIWAEVQVLSDLGRNTGFLNVQYENLIEEFNNI